MAEPLTPDMQRDRQLSDEAVAEGFERFWNEIMLVGPEALALSAQKESLRAIYAAGFMDGAAWGVRRLSDKAVERKRGSDERREG